MTIWFDVEDLFQYAGSGLTRTSGIQRVGLEIYRAAMAMDAPVGFVRHAPGTELFQVVPWEAIGAVFGAQATAQAAPAAARREPRQWFQRLPEEIRAPMLRAVQSQFGALAELGRFGAVAGAAPLRAAQRAMRRGTQTQGAARFLDLAQPGDTVLVLGSPWHRLYSPTARVLRGERRMRFGLLVHDLIPVRHPEWVDSGIRRLFEPWYLDALPHCDVVFANSAHTAADVEAFRAERRLRPGRAVEVLPMGTGFTGHEARADPAPGDYVLVVGTLEARKNHALAVRIWAGLLADERAGRRPAGSVPDLVFAGRIGWQVADLVAQLDRTGWLGGKVRLVETPTDAALQALYLGCRFTLFPSFSEGWGLPVSESLALGTPCVCSDAGALPEAGGRFCRSFDPDDTGAATRAVIAALDDPAGMAAWRADIRRSYRRVGWDETARAVRDAVAAL